MWISSIAAHLHRRFTLDEREEDELRKEVKGEEYRIGQDVSIKLVLHVIDEITPIRVETNLEEDQHGVLERREGRV